MVFYRSCAVLMAICIVVKVNCECPENCDNCDESKECSVCSKGFYVENGRCKACSSLCLDCTNSDDCTECIPGSWGSVCNETCLYVNNNMSKCKDGKCDQDTGKCSRCDNGAFGVICENPCPSNCQKNICDIHGNCSQGCLPGFHGDRCNNTCPKNCQDFVCAMNGNCTQGCNAGYYGIFCDKPCREFGKGCVNFECFRTNGTCIQECPHNCISCIYETNCTVCKTGYTLRNNTCCPQNCLNCDRDARCLNCYDGFYGDTCQESCMENCKTCSSRDNCTECGLQFYDSKSELEAGLCTCDIRECEVYFNVESCHQCKQLGWYTHERGCCPCPRYCKNQSDCEQFTGNCKNGCQRGWFGSHCDKRCNNKHCVTCKNYDTCQQCENENYGHACQYDCSLGCVQSSEGPLCDLETGHCLHGCENGTWGHTCNRTCSNNCVNGNCNSSTGHCLQCKSTHSGLFCEKEAASKVISNNPMVPIIIVCIATCVVVSIIVVALVMVFRKRGNNNSDIKNKSIELNAVGTTPAGAKRRHRQNSDDEVIIENAMYEPFHQSLYQGNEINAQNALLAKPGNTGGETTNDFQYSAPNDPNAVYSLPIKDNRHP